MASVAHTQAGSRNHPRWLCIYRLGQNWLNGHEFVRVLAHFLLKIDKHFNILNKFCIGK